MLSRVFAFFCFENSRELNRDFLPCVIFFFFPRNFPGNFRRPVGTLFLFVVPCFLRLFCMEFHPLILVVP